MAQASERIQEMMRRPEEQTAQACRLRERMQELKGQARSSDSSMMVTVARSGAVLDLQLNPDSMRQSHYALRRSIPGAIREATRKSSHQMDEVVQSALGDRAEQFKSAFNADSASGDIQAGGDRVVAQCDGRTTPSTTTTTFPTALSWGDAA
ncbi:YbaB/EbfC family nucleoid-associated protein [Saccharopolyspora spinosa]|uniref:YbaB/EbfC DNA-binding family protein n=1 Tax=Saccharopolyspora spinosa TaxID=60894 RepID=A0A2N3XUE7_SACSN|nr:YbaB/EbfC family nucleoid-associated protein [Saccharopolyspora spinosa]PKW14304.1 YbaB/EbfC DNA-binding family protein [Saccharopolyspora spinosa]